MMIKLVVGLAVLTSLVSANCRVGPKYWCSNIHQAAQCGKLSYCIQSVWIKEKVNIDTDEVCHICKDMVSSARNILMSNETQEQLLDIFEGSCNLIPIKIARTECNRLTDQYTPQLIETLCSELNPDSVCTVVGLCNSDRIDQVLENIYLQNGTCNTCQAQMSLAQRTLASMSDIQLEDKLHGLCRHTASYSDACMYTVSSDLYTLRAMLQGLVTPDVCTKSLCLSKDIVKLSQYSEDIGFTFCTTLVKDWLDVFASNATLEHLHKHLESLCDKLGDKYSDQCKRIVDHYYTPISDYIENIDPNMVCSAIGLIPANNSFHYNHAFPITTLFPSKQHLPLTPLVDAADESKPTCLLCEYVMSKLEIYLKKRPNQEQIEEYMDKFCLAVPTHYEERCKEFVEQYKTTIIQMIETDIHPSQICKEIGLCGRIPILPNDNKLETCQTCQIVAEEVISVLSDEEDINMVKNVLESICYRFPEFVDEPCEKFVDKYLVGFMNYVAKGVEGITPDQICDSLYMCSSY